MSADPAAEDYRSIIDKANPTEEKTPFVATPIPQLRRLRVVGGRDWGPMVIPEKPQIDPELEREFKTLMHHWRNETTHLSIVSEKANNFAYQQIIGMGDKVLPLIFRELESTTSDWFWALRAIARDKAPAIPAEDRGRVRRIAEIWMEWGKRHGYVSG